MELGALYETTGVLSTTVVDRGTDDVVAFAVAGLATPPFTAALLTVREPYSKALAFREIQAGREVLHPDLDRNPELAAREAGDTGLHLHFFEFHYIESTSPTESLRLRTALGLGFYERYAGMRLRLLTFECAGNEWIEESYRNGLHIHNAFPAQGERDVRTLLMGVDREQAILSGNAWLFNMFAPGRPRLPLSHTQRRILFHARAGLSDDEIAARVFLSPKSMKTVWDRIYEVFATSVPQIFEGRAKRRMVMDYVRSNPEEVWPCESRN
jgi:hypothetical protein